MQNSIGGPDFEGHDVFDAGSRIDLMGKRPVVVEPRFAFANKREARRLTKRMLKTNRSRTRHNDIFPPQNSQLRLELTPTPSVPYNKMNEVPENYQEMARQIILQQFVRPMEDDLPSLELHDFHFFWEDGLDKYARQLLLVQFTAM